MKRSYRIGRLLKRFIHDGFGDTFMDPELSDPGKQQAVDFYKKHKRLPLLNPKAPPMEVYPTSEKQKYLRYQKEIQAGRLSQNRNQPESPGKVLKLPLDSD
ncbi:MAG: hypothetical protein HQ517_15795 [SAR324 cluster bacterium]|nr:hypothetical protein [SAR324 cluster bacterium]